MEFLDCPKRDWRLYFNNTYMFHEELGIVKVSVDIPDVVIKPLNSKEGFTRCEDVGKLHIWWPRAGAYNHFGQAWYIDRKAERSMRKSAAGQHHYESRDWEGKVRPMKSDDLMQVMAGGFNHLTWEQGKAALDAGLVRSVAITRDIVIYKDEDKYKVYLRTELVGTLDEHGFTPENDTDPITKRAAYKLMKEGII